MGSGGDSAFVCMNSMENQGAPQLWRNFNFDSSKPPTIQGDLSSFNFPHLDLDDRKDNPIPNRAKASSGVENLVAQTYFANSGRFDKSSEKRNDS